MRHYILVRSAYGPGWSLEANQRRLALTEGITLRSLRSQTSRGYHLVVLLHAEDPLLRSRVRAFEALGADLIWTDDTGTPAEVAYSAYGARWSDAIGERDDTIAMTRLDDDDAFAPWAVAAIQEAAVRVQRRTALVFQLGVRVWRGGYTLVRHDSNAMHTLVTPPGDETIVYDYGHRRLRKYAALKMLDKRPAWLWSRHDDTISGWRTSERPLSDYIRSLFDVDWRLFGEPQRQPRQRLAHSGHVFR